MGYMNWKRYVNHDTTRNDIATEVCEDKSAIHLDVYELLSDYTQKTGRIVHAAYFFDVVETAVKSLMRSQKLRDLLSDTCDRALIRSLRQGAPTTGRRA